MTSLQDIAAGHVFILGASGLFFKALQTRLGTCISAEEELEGLEVPEMGGHRYPEIPGPSSLVPGMAGAGTRAAMTGTAVMATERGH